MPVTGSRGDAAVFASALAVARAFAAHLQFLHVRVDATAMAVTMAADGGGAMLTSGLVEQLEAEADQREQSARQAFDEFCRREGLALLEAPGGQSGPSAQWLRELGSEPDSVVDHGRAADLIVLGRPVNGEGVTPETIEGALLESGRPVLIPPAAPLAALPPKVAIAWNATRESARAVAAAMPLLALAKEIVILTVAEEERVSGEEAARLVSALRWHGVPGLRAGIWSRARQAVPTRSSPSPPSSRRSWSWAATGTAGCASGSSAASPAACCRPTCRCRC